jgi:uncharacterized protein (DUF924 family)
VSAIVEPETVLAFWRAVGPDKWFEKDAALDAEIRARFLPTYEAAAAGDLAHWATTPEGALALIVVLDQFARNMFRGDARTYAADPQARAAAVSALVRGFGHDFAYADRQFLFLPLLHSENLADQERAVALFREAGDAEGIRYAEHHADIIRRFGRFPHRNAILGRHTTPAEQEFLDAGGFAG